MRDNRFRGETVSRPYEFQLEEEVVKAVDDSVRMWKGFYPGQTMNRARWIRQAAFMAIVNPVEIIKRKFGASSSRIKIRLTPGDRELFEQKARQLGFGHLSFYLRVAIHYRLTTEKAARENPAMAQAIGIIRPPV